ncbi:MAG: hypothetical protein AAF564_17820 [Bacteroidota bacterium]
MGLTDERTAAARHIAKVLAGEDAREILERKTGRQLSEWEDKWASNLLRDVQGGYLNPDAWLTLNKIPLLTRRYGLMGDDLVFAMVDCNTISRHNRKYVPASGIKKQIACRLNPEKFAALSNMYPGKAA